MIIRDITTTQLENHLFNTDRTNAELDPPATSILKNEQCLPAIHTSDLSGEIAFLNHQSQMELSVDFVPSVAHWANLVVFYLLGCAFRDGATSLRKAAEAVIARQDQGLIAADVNCSRSNASRLIHHLGTEVFGPFFGDDDMRLLSYDEGKSASFSKNGCQAWELTRIFLNKYRLLPPW